MVRQGKASVPGLLSLPFVETYRVQAAACAGLPDIPNITRMNVASAKRMAEYRSFIAFPQLTISINEHSDFELLELGQVVPILLEHGIYHRFDLSQRQHGGGQWVENAGLHYQTRVAGQCSLNGHLL